MKRLTKRELAVEGKVRCVVCGQVIGLSERLMMPVIAEDLMIWVSGACRECFEVLSEVKENSPHPTLSQREREPERRNSPHPTLSPEEREKAVDK